MRIELASGTAVELAEPPSGPPLRGLVLAPDVNGLRALYDDLCAQLAADHGWVVAAVEPFPGQETLPLDQRLAGTIDANRIVDDLELAASELKRRTGVTRVGVLGFCMGGMSTFRAAGTGTFDRAVAFYGMVRPPAQWSAPGNDPLDALAEPECCPVLAIFGGVDRWTPPNDVDAVRNAGAHVNVRVYDDADHGFVHNPDGPAHRPDDAADAWRWAVEFLA
jgi:carboxymethylenebutenolidase